MRRLLNINLALVAFFVSIVCEPLQARSVEPLSIGADQTLDGIQLLDYIEQFYDSEKTYELKDVLVDDNLVFEDLTGYGTTLYGDGRFWFRAYINYEGDTVRDALIKHDFSYTDYVSFYQLNPSSGEYEALLLGDKVPFVDRPVKYRSPVFPVSLQPGLNTFYISIETAAPIHGKFTLWDEKPLNDFMRSEYIFIGLMFGIVVVMIGYNGLLAIRFNNPAYFLYVGYLCAFATVQLTFNGLYQEIFASDSDRNWMGNEGIVVCAELTAIFASVFALAFLDVRKRMPIIYKGILVFYIFSATNIVIATIHYNASVAIVLATNGLISGLLISVGIKGCLDKFRPAYFYTAAWFCILGGSLITMARIYGFLPDNPFTAWSQFAGGALEVVLLSLALGDKMRLLQERAHEKISELAGDLKDANAELEKHIEQVEEIVEEKTRDIKSILKNIRQGIFTISSHDGKVMPEYSEHLEEIFDKTDLAGNDPFELLFEGADIASDKANQTITVVTNALGEDILNFEANMDLLADELHFVNPENPEDIKILQLEWDAIEHNDQIDKILVTVRDVTELRRLEAIQAKQKQELEAIGQILAISPEKFQGFIENCRDFFDSCKKLLDADPLSESLAKLYMNIHTMKGMSRSFDLDLFSNALHEYEEVIMSAQALETLDEKSSQALRAGLSPCNDALEYYCRINEEKLGRKENSAEAGPMQWMRKKVKELRELDFDTLRDSQRSTISSMISEMEAISAKSFEQSIEPVITSLPSVASSLSKPPPYVTIQDKAPLIKADGQHLLESVFVHLLTNAIDHGIETPEQREELGKNRKGEITIKAEQEGNGQLTITVADDGSGLNVDAISKKAGLNRPLSKDEILERVFDPGFSTKESASMYSGRGVGMGAVKTYLENYDCDIKLEFLEDVGTGGYRKFELVIHIHPNLLICESQELEQKAAS